ncbi:HNH endonuclease [Patescibacteria group bacterium]|nr:HNH endonuclease [Patescibacteria group bacterium]
MKFGFQYYHLVSWDYGAKKKWTEEDLRRATAHARSIRQILHELHLVEAGGNYAQVQKYLQYYKIDTGHLKGRGWNKGLKGIGMPHIPLQSILVTKSTFQSYKLKKRLFHAGIKQQKCEICGWSKKSSDGRIPLELDHINGDRTDNTLINLRVLCPNCHSLQPTHRGKNRQKRL